MGMDSNNFQHKNQCSGGVKLSEGGGDGVHDVGEDLLHPRQRVRDRPQLGVDHRALHQALVCPSVFCCPGEGLDGDDVTELFSNYEAGCSICDGPDGVGDALEALPVAVALADHPLNAQRVVSSRIFCPFKDVFDYSG